MKIQQIKNYNTNFQAKKFKKPRKTVQPQIDPSRILREAYSKAYGKPYSECGYWGRFKIELANKLSDKFHEIKEMVCSPFAHLYIFFSLMPVVLPLLLVGAIVKGCNSGTHTSHGNCHTERIHHCNCQHEQDEKTLNLGNRF